MSDVVVENVEQLDANKTVSYESHKKLLDETKKARLKAQELEQKMAELQANKEQEETNKLIDQKKYEELAVRLEKENSLLKHKMEQENARIQQIVKTKALKAKLVDIEEKYINKFASFDDVRLSSDGEVDDDSLEYVVQKFKDENPVLFNTKQVNQSNTNQVASNTKNTSFNVNNKPLNIGLTDIKQMSSKEILELMRKR